MQNEKGFTLIEILLMVTMIAILTIAAVSNYMKTSETFGYLGKYKSIVNTVRMGRFMALTNGDIKIGRASCRERV